MCTVPRQFPKGVQLLQPYPMPPSNLWPVRKAFWRVILGRGGVTGNNSRQSRTRTVGNVRPGRKTEWHRVR